MNDVMRALAQYIYRSPWPGADCESKSECQPAYLLILIIAT